MWLRKEMEKKTAKTIGTLRGKEKGRRKRSEENKEKLEKEDKLKEEKINGERVNKKGKEDRQMKRKEGCN